jgi:hypothetical protein
VGLGQGFSRIIGEDAARLGVIARWQIVIATRANQFRARLSPHHESAAIDRHTASQQIRVSEVGQEDELHAVGQGEGGEEVVPIEMAVGCGLAPIGKEQTGPGRVRRLAGEKAVTTDVDQE